jgi:hypothetical protein
MERQRQALAEQRGTVEREAELANAALEGMRGSLKADADHIRTAAEIAAQELDSAGRGFQLRARGFADAADQAAEQVRGASRALQSDADRLLALADQLRAQAMERIHDVRNQEKDSFLRTSALVVEGLQSLAIDIDRVLERDLPEDLWKRYVSGEKDVFLRRLLTIKTRLPEAPIMERYKINSEFRRNTDRYLQQFEETVGRALDLDHEGVLAKTFLTSETGKVYLLLAKSVGRLKN